MSSPSLSLQKKQESPTTKPPRLAFVGVGWIGLNRLQAAKAFAPYEIAAIADVSPAARESAAQAVPGVPVVEQLEEVLNDQIDGVVIATPSALHAAQSIQALKAGKAVFCQKPLARTAQETREVLAAAQAADRLLGVDLSYRHVSGVAQMRERIQSGHLGDVFAAELVFHNAYGPDKPWFYDARLSGGGCLMDLGTHLVDLAQWALGSQRPQLAVSHLFQAGKRLDAAAIAQGAVEDYAQITWDTEQGTSVRLACSWNLSAGGDAVIQATFYGTQGAVRLRNLDHSFYDFTVEAMHGTQCEPLVPRCDDWGGRGLAAWAQQLSESRGYDPSVESLVGVAEVLDQCYGRAGKDLSCTC